MKKSRLVSWMVLVSIILTSTVLFFMAGAEPEGASITNTSSSSKNTTFPTSRTDPKGTITTLVIDTIQQNTKWKAYVGNVSGLLVLRDADGYSIYEWTNVASPNGEVYMTRNSTVDWNTIQCANVTNVITEQDTLGHTSGAADSLNETFNSKIHREFLVHETTISNSSCKTVFPWINHTSQTQEENASFIEMLLMDASKRIVYTSFISQDTSGYRNDTHNETNSSATFYDFQAIVPDYTSATIATYYFYVEIDS